MKSRKAKLSGSIKWELIIVLVLCVLHLICNLQIKLLSFSSDEFIPLIISADKNGFDWLHSRPMNFYYGYPISIVFIPLFKIKALLKNTFWFTQCILLINSSFHVIASVLIFRMLKLLNDNKIREWVLAAITLLSSLFLQFFIVGEGSQIESMFIMSNIVAIYNIVKITKTKNSSIVNYILVAFFSVLAYANNSRAIVIIVASVLTLAYYTVVSKKYKKPEFYIYFVIFAVIFVVHKKFLHPMFLSYMESGALNTDESGFIQKIFLCFKDKEVFLTVVKTVISNLWASNISTFGFFIVSIFLVAKSLVVKLKQKRFTECSIDILLLLLFMGTIVLTAINPIYSNRSCFNYSTTFDRADQLFYVRYMTVVTVPFLAVGMLYFLSYGLRFSDVAIVTLVTFLVNKIYIVCVTPYIDGLRYGINNSAFISLLMGNFQDTYRYGIVDSSFFLYAEVLVFVFLIFIIVANVKRKHIAVTVVLLTIFTVSCFHHAISIASRRSDYYDSVFQQDIIDYCNNSECVNIYVNNDSFVAQYQMPDKVVYNRYTDGMDMVVVRESSRFRPDEGEFELEYTNGEYLVYSRCS